MSFFHKDTDITDYTIEDRLLNEFDFGYSIYFLYSRIAPNGGPILLTDDFLDTSPRFQKVDPKL